MDLLTNGLRVDPGEVGEALYLPLQLLRFEERQVGRELADDADLAFDPLQAVRPLRDPGIDDDVDQGVGAALQA